jgi:hypothetical protein
MLSAQLRHFGGFGANYQQSKMLLLLLLYGSYHVDELVQSVT